VANHLCKRYSGTGNEFFTAVADVSLTVHAGEIVLISGPNGSGKTTLLSMFGCLLLPTSGTLTVLGRSVRKSRPAELGLFRRQKLGFVFQAFRLLDGLTVLENVELPLYLNGCNRRETRKRARALLARLGIARKESVRASRLSGGEKQRVAIARALANEPQLILADEPTGNLDSHGGQEVIELLTTSAAASGTTVVIVSHDQRIERFADRVIRMEDGRLQEQALSESSQPYL
jgi:putative ABC transport system ATP-binding protein